uniref:Uncharacterized protein n=1 Tax=Globisporangium ultimum (strain ATCC 200006 / CBS 805.95 / DAOM BR144) TaxID=431595 RepID=K3W8W5_GLOUD
MNEGLSLSWEWCIPHMANAATKWAGGLADNKADSHNIEMTELVERIKKTICTVRAVEKMGDLFQALCQLHGVWKDDAAARLQLTPSGVR